jgi:hypothetical protein
MRGKDDDDIELFEFEEQQDNCVEGGGLICLEEEQISAIKNKDASVDYDYNMRMYLYSLTENKLRYYIYKQQYIDYVGQLMTKSKQIFNGDADEFTNKGVPTTIFDKITFSPLFVWLEPVIDCISIGSFFEVGAVGSPAMKQQNVINAIKQKRTRLYDADELFVKSINEKINLAVIDKKIDDSISEYDRLITKYFQSNSNNDERLKAIVYICANCKYIGTTKITNILNNNEEISNISEYTRNDTKENFSVVVEKFVSDGYIRIIM